MCKSSRSVSFEKSRFICDDNHIGLCRLVFGCNCLTTGSQHEICKYKHGKHIFAFQRITLDYVYDANIILKGETNLFTHSWNKQIKRIFLCFGSYLFFFFSFTHLSIKYATEDVIKMRYYNYYHDSFAEWWIASIYNWALVYTQIHTQQQWVWFHAAVTKNRINTQITTIVLYIMVAIVTLSLSFTATIYIKSVATHEISSKTHFPPVNRIWSVFFRQVNFNKRMNKLQV